MFVSLIQAWTWVQPPVESFITLYKMERLERVWGNIAKHFGPLDASKLRFDGAWMVKLLDAPQCNGKIALCRDFADNSMRILLIGKDVDNARAATALPELMSVLWEGETLDAQ